MLPWISAVKNSIKSLESKMREKYTQCVMRFAFVRYTDYDQPVESRISWLDFTRLVFYLSCATCICMYVAITLYYNTMQAW